MKEEKQQFNVYLTPGTIKRIKHCSIDEQLSLSDLVEKVLSAYLARETESESVATMQENQSQQERVLSVQPMVHVDNMEKAVDFYSKLGATVLNKSRDGDWALLRFGTTELGLLAHPANPEQNEGKVELIFEFADSLEDLEKKLREDGVRIVRSASDEGFGSQLQVEDSDGMLIKINHTEPELYR